MIAIEKPIRIDRDPILIAELDPSFPGKIDLWSFSHEHFFNTCICGRGVLPGTSGKKYRKNY
jgi:hypothetical protein